MWQGCTTKLINEMGAAVGGIFTAFWRVRPLFGGFSCTD
jgi:hypothetical protein